MVQKEPLLVSLMNDRDVVQMDLNYLLAISGSRLLVMIATVSGNLRSQSKGGNPGLIPGGTGVVIERIGNEAVRRWGYE